MTNNPTKKRVFTIIIAPHSEKLPFSLTLPFFWCKVGVVAIIFFSIGLFFLANSYISLSNRVGENVYLRETNRAQREAIDDIALETQRLLEQIEEIELLSENVAEILGVGTKNE